MVSEILAFYNCLKDKMIRLKNTKHWSEVDILGTLVPEAHEIFDITSPETNNQLMTEILSYKEIIAFV